MFQSKESDATLFHVSKLAKRCRNRNRNRNRRTLSADGPLASSDQQDLGLEGIANFLALHFAMRNRRSNLLCDEEPQEHHVFAAFYYKFMT